MLWQRHWLSYSRLVILVHVETRKTKGNGSRQGQLNSHLEDKESPTRKVALTPLPSTEGFLEKTDVLRLAGRKGHSYWERAIWVWRVQLSFLVAHTQGQLGTNWRIQVAAYQVPPNSLCLQREGCPPAKVFCSPGSCCHSANRKVQGQSLVDLKAI